MPPAITMCLPTVVGRDSGDGVSGHLTHTGACAQVVTLTNLMDILSRIQHYQGEMIWGLKEFASQWSKCLFLSIPTPGRSEACSSVMWRTGNCLAEKQEGGVNYSEKGFLSRELDQGIPTRPTLCAHSSSGPSEGSGSGGGQGLETELALLPSTG